MGGGGGWGWFVAVGTVAAVVNPFTTALFCHFAPRFPLANLSLIFLISVSSWRHQRPFKTHGLPTPGKKLNYIWPLKFASSPGNLCLLWEQGTTPVTGIISVCSLCLNSKFEVVSVATKYGLDLPITLSLYSLQRFWVKSGWEEGSQWSSILKILIVRREDDISSLNMLLKR